MTVIELFDAVDAMLDAAIKWIMLGSAIASLLLLAAVAVVAWAAKRVRRGLDARIPAHPPPLEALSARLSPEVGFDPGEPRIPHPEPPRAPQKPAKEPQ